MTDNLSMPIKGVLNKLSIKDLDIKGKRLFIRVDFNVPLDENLNITDDRRIRSALPTINYAIDEGCKVILASHLGRPKGKADNRYTLAPVARRLQRLIKKEVTFIPDCVGPEVESLVSTMSDGDIALLENLRFHAEEEKNDEQFSKSLSKLADYYINDAFGAAHRSHASIVGIAKFLPSAAGFLLQKEIEYLQGVVNHPVTLKTRSTR
jgi:phosphoglycerate kinase